MGSPDPSAIKRYTITATFGPIEVDESVDGEWVRYEDVADLAERLEAESDKAARAQVDSARACSRMREQKAELRQRIAVLEHTQADLVARANQLPGLTATLDELIGFTHLVRELLHEHDATKEMFAAGERPDSPGTVRIRAALAALPRSVLEIRKGSHG